MNKNAEQARLPNQQLVSLSEDKTTNYSHQADSIISSVVSSENQDSFSWVEVTGVGCYRRVREFINFFSFFCIQLYQIAIGTLNLGSFRVIIKIPFPLCYHDRWKKG